MKFKRLVAGCEAYNGDKWLVFSIGAIEPEFAWWNDKKGDWMGYSPGSSLPTHYLPGSNVLEAEPLPRRMPVWNWRHYPNVKFTFVFKNETVEASWVSGRLISTRDKPMYVVQEALEAIGTEVLETE